MNYDLCNLSVNKNKDFCGYFTMYMDIFIGVTDVQTCTSVTHQDFFYVIF